MEHLRTVHYDPNGLVIHANGKKLRPFATANGQSLRDHTQSSCFDVGDRVTVDGNVIRGILEERGRIELWHPELRDTEQ